jgi:molybdopterin molybdotransferase
MDGYAVRAKDVFGASEGLPAALNLVGEVSMGSIGEIAIGPGQTARVWTGGALPKGADAVVPLELARVGSLGLVEPFRPVFPFENVVLADEDAAKGTETIPAGRILRPQELALLAAFGQSEALVRRKPKVAVLATGDEVVEISANPAPGQVRDANSVAVAAIAETAGGSAKIYGLVPDDLTVLTARLGEALAESDVVVLTGGSSAGQKDFTLKAIKSLPKARVLAHGAAISPGKPLILAKIGQKSLFGLPGHPAGALITAEIFLKALIFRLTGAKEPEWARGLKAKMSRPAPSSRGRREYFRVKLSLLDGELWATPILGKSGLISTLVKADALAVCPEETEGLAEGDWAEIRLS